MKFWHKKRTGGSTVSHQLPYPFFHAQPVPEMKCPVLSKTSVCRRMIRLTETVFPPELERCFAGMTAKHFRQKTDIGKAEFPGDFLHTPCRIEQFIFNGPQAAAGDIAAEVFLIMPLDIGEQPGQSSRRRHFRIGQCPCRQMRATISRAKTDHCRRTSPQERPVFSLSIQISRKSPCILPASSSCN